MKEEVNIAVAFIVRLLRLNCNSSVLSDKKLLVFKEALINVLMSQYRDHWFPDMPSKGSGYRCVRNNGKLDPLVTQACSSCGLDANLLHGFFPSELTLWIDPKEVAYRIGENGSICSLTEDIFTSKDNYQQIRTVYKPSSIVSPSNSPKQQQWKDHLSCKETVQVYSARKPVMDQTLTPFIST